MQTQLRTTQRERASPISYLAQLSGMISNGGHSEDVIILYYTQDPHFDPKGPFTWETKHYTVIKI